MEFETGVEGGAEGAAMESTASDATADTGTEGEGGAQQGDTSGERGRDASGKFVKGQGGKAAAPVASTAAKASATEEELEEIALGHVRGKVPKQIAQRIKELERGFHTKSQAASELAKKLEQYDKGDIKAILKLKGVDPEEFAEATLAEKLEMMQMSPEQKRIRELEEYKRQQEDREATDKKAKEDKAAQEEEAEVQQNLQADIIEALKTIKLPDDPGDALSFTKRVAALMKDSRAAYRAGTYPRALTAKEAASIIEKRWNNSTTGTIRKLTPQGIYDLLGEEKFHELREWDLKRVTQSRTSETPPSSKRPGETPVSNSNKGKQKSVDERGYRAYWDSI